MDFVFLMRLERSKLETILAEATARLLANKNKRSFENARKLVSLVKKALRCKGKLGQQETAPVIIMPSSPYTDSSFGDEWREQD